MTPDNRIIRAFRDISDKNALAWSVLNEKSERAVTSAICLAANRRAGRRVAWVEFKRMDLVVVDAREPRVPLAAYEAKAAYLSGYTDKRIARRDRWLGEILDPDFGKVREFARRFDTVRRRGCLFYLYEVGDPSKQLKYGGANSRTLGEAELVVQAMLPRRKFVRSATINCGEADGTKVRIRLLVFDA